MRPFETLLEEHRRAVERYIRFRVPIREDADDVLQETFLTAFLRFDQLRSEDSFKPWLLAIARRKCADFFRAKGRVEEIPMDTPPELPVPYNRLGRTRPSAVETALEQLSGKDCEVLSLSYYEELSQGEIARRLDVPVGTVKSRLHTARARFKEAYLSVTETGKGERNMKELPLFLPKYEIIPSDKPPFPVVWEELMGWCLVPKLGEKLSWAMYDPPSWERTELCQMEVLGPAEVHGIPGVEFRSLEYQPMDCNALPGQDPVERRFVAQLTDTHCRFLAESQVENGVRKYRTFLDGDAFLGNWGFGEDNCGNETHLSPKGDIRREGNIVTSANKPFLLDVVGRYTVKINGKTYDTVCVVDIETYNEGVVSEQFLDRSGRTVLWRRFNRDDWAVEKYGAPWSRQFPDAERLIVNGALYVHWYDCITDYIL